MNIAQLEAMTLTDLRVMSKDLEIQGATRMKKEDLILRIMQTDAERRGLELRGGILEIMGEGMGFLRAGHYPPGPNDIYVSQSQIRRLVLQCLEMFIQPVLASSAPDQYYRVPTVESINGL